jgi:metal-responsive CopG/Arc/MetJ family transcriptional regulator
MRIRTNLIIEEKLLAKIDVIAGDKNKRAAVIETALREFIAREEIKAANNPQAEVVGEKTVSRTSRAGV